MLDSVLMCCQQIEKSESPGIVQMKYSRGDCDRNSSKADGQERNFDKRGFLRWVSLCSTPTYEAILGFQYCLSKLAQRRQRL